MLIFQYPQPGQSCFSRRTSSTDDHWNNDDKGVLVKLADLGTSAFIGPSGFRRKYTTTGYAAPEVLRYSGKELLTKKVGAHVLLSI